MLVEPELGVPERIVASELVFVRIEPDLSPGLSQVMRDISSLLLATRNFVSVADGCGVASEVLRPSSARILPHLTY